MIKLISKTIAAATMTMAIGAITPAYAVSLAELSGSSSGNSDRANKSTTINSDVMDIDFQNNTTVFSGNVFVNDPQLTIKCDKMTIFLRDKEKVKEKPGTSNTGKTVPKEKAGEALGSIAPGGAGKELDKVVCTGKVVIVRKTVDKEEAKHGDQKAEAGKAVYDFREGTICLTEDNPKVSRGAEGDLSGARITLWLESERVKVEGNDQQAQINIKNVSALNKDTPPKENPEKKESKDTPEK